MAKGYGQHCPIAMAAEVLAERWTPLIIRNLYMGCHRFGEILQGCPRMSTTLLSKRLRELERDDVIQVDGSGRSKRYVLTTSGHELADVVLQMGAWGARWLEAAPADRDPFIALWSWARLIDVDAIPARPVTVRFDLIDRPRDRFWLLLQRPRPEVCVTYPGRAEDVVVRTDVDTLVAVQCGKRPLTSAMASGDFVVEGDVVLVRDLPTWGGISALADLRA